jgi:biotin transport system substrate-specific component
MPNLMENKEILRFICLSILGCGLISIASLIKIRFIPVPFTMQTLAIFILAFTQSPKQALGSVVCYLFCASIGLPVFCGKSNPLWIMGKCGGYLIAFPLAAYLTAKIKSFSLILAFVCGQLVIYLIGFIWLVPFVGPTTALMKGVIFFIPADLLKGMAALVIATKFKKKENQ